MAKSWWAKLAEPGPLDLSQRASIFALMPVGPLARRGPIRVLPYFGFRSASHLHLTVRVLQGGDPQFAARSSWRNFSTMLGLYASHEVAGVAVRLEYRSVTGQIHGETRVSDDEGFVHFELAIDSALAQLTHTVWEQVSLDWTLADGSQAAKARL